MWNDLWMMAKNHRSWLESTTLPVMLQNLGTEFRDRGGRSTTFSHLHLPLSGFRVLKQVFRKDPLYTFWSVAGVYAGYFSGTSVFACGLAPKILSNILVFEITLPSRLTRTNFDGFQSIVPSIKSLQMASSVRALCSLGFNTMNQWKAEFIGSSFRFGVLEEETTVYKLYYGLGLVERYCGSNF